MIFLYFHPPFGYNYVLEKMPKQPYQTTPIESRIFSQR
jgi:hypothetical protein